ncbi:phosphate ABC transporter permease PstA [Aestuariibius sp. 2305UL40-4]|uniref:phosphate ABC transporter permease PstA n=1 Tax=Aestuariibius violaceus TaxID=3234132 RepID=UPI00345E611B
MTDATATPASSDVSGSLLSEDQRTRRRNRAERRFQIYGLTAIGIAVAALLALVASILINGLSSFQQTFITIDVPLPVETLDSDGDGQLDRVTTFTIKPLLEQAFIARVDELGVRPEGMSDGDIGAMISGEAPATFLDFVRNNPDRIGDSAEFRILANGRIDGYLKGGFLKPQRVTMESAERDANVTPDQLRLTDALVEQGVVAKQFNWGFITAPDASENRPEAAGLGVAIIGSLYMMIVVLVLALPIGVAASIYLEEFAPKNWFTDLIEVNISNLAAVPSIVYGILGLAIFINFAGLPQSSPLVGGLVLTLMTLPTIIIATRASLKSVPPSIRDAALGVGASKMQTVFHHVLPLAAPGILTGTIIGLAQALGETAPLLLIGMVAFVRDYPDLGLDGFTDPATALPVQVYNFTQRADPAFVERASGAIITLLVFLLLMNALAIFLRRRFERRW